MLVSKIDSLECSMQKKIFTHKIKDDQNLLSVAQQVWESVHANDKKEVYRQIVCSGVDVNAIHGQASFSISSSLTFIILYKPRRAGKA